MHSHCLKRTDDYCLTWHEFAPSDPRVLICFSEHAGGLGARGFGTDLCEKKKWNTVFVGKRTKSRFQGLSAEEFATILAPILDGRQMLTYGASAGGYAALYYGGLINARILAASPRNSLHPIHAKNGVVSPEFVHQPSLSDLPLAAHNPIIVYDSVETRDERTVQNWVLPSYPDANVIRVWNAGHMALQKLKKAGSLSRLVGDFMAHKDMEGWTYEFPEGTIDRSLDEARKTYERNDFSGAVDAMIGHFDVLGSYHLINTFADAALQTGHKGAIELLLNAATHQARCPLRRGVVDKLKRCNSAVR